MESVKNFFLQIQIKSLIALLYSNDMFMNKQTKWFPEQKNSQFI